jgi:hypothetical protein
MKATLYFRLFGDEGATIVGEASDIYSKLRHCGNFKSLPLGYLKPFGSG